MPETQQTVINYLNSFARKLGSNTIDDWFEKLHAANDGNTSAKAALDMALWDLKAQIKQTTIANLLGIKSSQFPLGAYTIGLCNFEEMQHRFNEAKASGFKLFKLKLNGEADEEVIRNFRKLSTEKFAVDVNQGWKSREQGIEKIKLLESEQCLLVEQPLPKHLDAEMCIIKSEINTILFADESCQTIDDLERLREGFDGINIKLMKCGGISKALPMIKKAREMGFKILIGCMSESSVGCTAAAQLSPLADYADLDGPYLLANDPFTGMKVKDGRIVLHPLKQLSIL